MYEVYEFDYSMVSSLLFVTVPINGITDFIFRRAFHHLLNMQSLCHSRNSLFGLWYSGNAIVCPLIEAKCFS